MALNIVRQYQRLVVLRWGRFMELRGPGARWTWPVVDHPIRVDLRESFLNIERQTCITRDNAPIAIDFLIYWKVMEEQAERTVLEVANFVGAAAGIATTTLRAVIGDISLDDVLAKREDINQVLRVKLDEVTARWGVKVTAVEIREIEPPKEVQDAMNRQMAAERIRRATITESEGLRQAAINKAEGEKQAAILRAEGNRQAAILEAEGNRQAAILNAEGFSQALNLVYQVASTVDAKTMSLQYFDTLKHLGGSPATKFIFPMEFTSMLRPFLNLGDHGEQQGRGSG
ncbi:MAG: SPFH/Band 7/PHB domain protein [Chloroflexi bacterium]|nr:SPFH/Band 7/PHB domain protein [Chloroflexota bacterium]